MRNLIKSIGLYFALCIWSCAAWAELEHRLNVAVSNYPLAYFAERIGGARVKVQFNAPTDQDPAYWRPESTTLNAMARADLIVLNGADYEKWLTQATLPRLKLVDTSSAFKDRYIVITQAVTHSHGGSGLHAHDGTAFTTWLDFQQAQQQATALAAALIRKRPEWRSEFESRLADLQHDLAVLDQTLAALLPTAGVSAWASHPVYQYLARRYGVELRSVHWEPGETPPPAEWQALREALQTHPARWMLWEGEPSAETAVSLQSLGLRAVVFDPCANTPHSGDFLSVMQQNIAQLKAALESIQ